MIFMDDGGMTVNTRLAGGPDMPETPWRSLARFEGLGYDKGRSRICQALWFAVMNLIFSRWWCPARWRPMLLRLFGARIGSGVLIRHRVRVLWPWKLSIGEHSWIGEGVWLLNLEPIVIGRDVCVSQEAFLCTGGHDPNSDTFEFDNGPIHIDNETWIAAQALVMRNVRIGRGVVVGARGIVTRDIPDGGRVKAGDNWCG
jgi:putative colanic acid biosynthesis acetyltransferase WcaF